MPEELAEAAPCRGQPGTGRGESLPLGQIQAVAGHLRCHEVGHDIEQLDVGQPRMILLQQRQFGLVQTKSRHAGVDVQQGREAVWQAAGSGGPGVKLMEGAEYRRDGVSDVVGLAARDQPPEYG